PETILQSDVLDIIFENRNKTYGAYYLRKHYDNYLLKALGIGLPLFCSLVLLLSFHDGGHSGPGLQIAPVGPTLVIGPPAEPQPDQPKPPKRKPGPTISAPSEKWSTIQIVPPNTTIKEKMPELDEMEGKNVSTETRAGEPGGELQQQGQGE